MNPHADSVQQPSDEQALLGWTRYEKARKLNVAQWAELHQRNLRGENFDDMIDALPATTQPVQQDKLRQRFEQWWCDKRDLHMDPIGGREFSIAWDAVEEFAAPPAEKQAAPSGEDKARLDWIEQRANDKGAQVQIARSLLGSGYEIATKQGVRVHNGTLREAIDSARATPSPQDKGAES
jgi:hypothetical protein